MPDEEEIGSSGESPREELRSRRVDDGPRLPYARAFVVQFTADTDAGLEYAAGRIEHLETGRRERFESADDLLLWISALLPRDQHSRGPSPREDRASP
ncbi:MAG TPA: hypothetical protein VIA61_00995 [Methylomirabilota bacterium]|jgi:hypothetical protein